MKDYCKEVCNFDPDTATCVGCGRTSEEVTEWWTASDRRKKEIAKAARQRTREAREKSWINDVPVLDGEWDWVLDAIDGPLKK